MRISVRVRRRGSAEYSCRICDPQIRSDLRSTDKEFEGEGEEECEGEEEGECGV